MTASGATSRITAHACASTFATTLPAITAPQAIAATVGSRATRRTTRGPHEPGRLAEDSCDHDGRCDVDHDLGRRHLGDQLDGDHGAGGFVRASQRAATELASAAHVPTSSTRRRHRDGGQQRHGGFDGDTGSPGDQWAAEVGSTSRADSRDDRRPRRPRSRRRTPGGTRGRRRRRGPGRRSRPPPAGLRMVATTWIGRAWVKRGERGEGHHRGSPPIDAGGGPGTSAAPVRRRGVPQNASGSARSAAQFIRGSAVGRGIGWAAPLRSDVSSDPLGADGRAPGSQPEEGAST